MIMMAPQLEVVHNAYITPPNANTSFLQEIMQSTRCGGKLIFILAGDHALSHPGNHP